MGQVILLSTLIGRSLETKEQDGFLNEQLRSLIGRYVPRCWSHSSVPLSAASFRDAPYYTTSMCGYGHVTDENNAIYAMPQCHFNLWRYTVVLILG